MSRLEAYSSQTLPILEHYKDIFTLKVIKKALFKAFKTLGQGHREEGGCCEGYRGGLGGGEV